MPSDAQAKIIILGIGLEPSLAPIFDPIFKFTSLVMAAFDLEKLAETVQSPPPTTVLVGSPPAGVSLIEAAQLLRMNYQEAVIVHVTTSNAGFDKKTFIKNGFNDAFLLPAETQFFQVFLKDQLSRATQGAVKSFKPVKLIDVAPDVVLDFDTTVFLPMNNKYVRFSSAGEALAPERAERLQKHHVASLYIERSQIKKFYDFTAHQLKKLNTDQKISATEKQERAQAAVRDIMSSLFNDNAKDSGVAQGKEIVKDCQEIVKSFVMSTVNQKMDWYEKLLKASEDASGGYSKAISVSTFASLFSIALNIGKPEELAIAGLLHSIGITDLPATIQSKAESTLTPEELVVFKTYPQRSIDLIKSKKLIVSEAVMKMIVQHRERYDGQGFPAGLPGNRIMKEAQILSLAAEFCGLISPMPGQPTKTPLEALQWIKHRTDNNPALNYYDPDIVQKVLSVFVATQA